MEMYLMAKIKKTEKDTPSKSTSNSYTKSNKVDRSQTKIGKEKQMKFKRSHPQVNNLPRGSSNSKYIQIKY